MNKHEKPLEITLFDKQAEAYLSTARETYYVGGIQCAKSTTGGLWMLAKTIEHPGPDESFIICAPDYKTMSQATLKTFRKFAGPYGHYKETKAEFQLDSGGTVYIRTATHPESLEGITNVRAIWGDESGRFSRYFAENVRGRAAFKEAPIFWTTTPYAMNWMAEDVKAILEGQDTENKLIQLRSIDSPYFPRTEYERQQRKLDPRRFAMKYEGVFGQMQGLVYPEINLCKSFALSQGTVNYGGIDWGHTDPFVLVSRGITPDGVHYRRDEFYKTGLIASEIMNIAKARHQIYQYRQVFCDPSRPEFIEELARSGVPAVPANNEIRLGIDRHSELIKEKRYFIFEDMNPLGLDEYRTYHYPEPEEMGFDDDSKELLPVDANNHGLDCDRYITAGTFMGQAFKKSVPRVPGDHGKLTEYQKLQKLMRPNRNAV